LKFLHEDEKGKGSEKEDSRYRNHDVSVHKTERISEVIARNGTTNPFCGILCHRPTRQLFATFAKKDVMKAAFRKRTELRAKEN